VSSSRSSASVASVGFTLVMDRQLRAAPGVLKSDGPPTCQIGHR
jgi:hypothetical protein